MARSLMLFVHVVGVLGLFTGLGLEWLSLDAVRRSTVRSEAVRWVNLSITVPRITAIAVAAVIASGFFLGAGVGVLAEAWMRGSYAALVIIGIIAGPVTQPRMRALQQAASDPNDGAATALRAAASNSTLRLSVRLRIVFGLAVVYLMVAKPDTFGSVVVMSLATIAAITLVVSRRPAASSQAFAR